MTTTLEIASPLAMLVTFVQRRAGIDPCNYGGGADGWRAYRNESRAVTRDLHRFRKLLAESYALNITDQDVLEAAPRAFSGRLEWKADHWAYCTGQYFPTEYRKAACAVLECAISVKKQAQASTVPLPRFETVADVKAYHQQTGGHWFDRSAMRFFGTKIHIRRLILGKYFVTSEQPSHGAYTLRQVNQDGDISTVGELCGYSSVREAAMAARIKG